MLPQSHLSGTAKDIAAPWSGWIRTPPIRFWHHWATKEASHTKSNSSKSLLPCVKQIINVVNFLLNQTTVSTTPHHPQKAKCEWQLVFPYWSDFHLGCMAALCKEIVIRYFPFGCVFSQTQLAPCSDLWIVVPLPYSQTRNHLGWKHVFLYEMFQFVWSPRNSVTTVTLFNQVLMMMMMMAKTNSLLSVFAGSGWPRWTGIACNHVDSSIFAPSAARTLL